MQFLQAHWAARQLFLRYRELPNGGGVCLFNLIHIYSRKMHLRIITRVTGCFCFVLFAMTDSSVFAPAVVRSRWLPDGAVYSAVHHHAWQAADPEQSV